MMPKVDDSVNSIFETCDEVLGIIAERSYGYAAYITVAWKERECTLLGRGVRRLGGFDSEGMAAVSAFEAGATRVRLVDGTTISSVEEYPWPREEGEDDA